MKFANIMEDIVQICLDIVNEGLEEEDLMRAFIFVDDIVLIIPISRTQDCVDSIYELLEEHMGIMGMKFGHGQDKDGVMGPDILPPKSQQGMKKVDDFQYLGVRIHDDDDKNVKELPTKLREITNHKASFGALDIRLQDTVLSLIRPKILNVIWSIRNKEIAKALMTWLYQTLSKVGADKSKAAYFAIQKPPPWFEDKVMSILDLDVQLMMQKVEPKSKWRQVINEFS